MRLFKYEGYRVVISEEAMMLKPFKKLWDRDTSPDKSNALNELAFVYFYTDPRSDYQYITIPEDRLKAIDFYDSFKPMSALLLDDSRKMINKLRDYINNIDFNEKDDKGKPIYTMNTITSTIKQIPELTKTLNEAERMVNQEMLEAAKARGSVELTILDTDLDI